MNRLIKLLFLLVAFPVTALAGIYNPDNIPMPKNGVYPMYTSNPDSILADSTVRRIEETLYQLESATGVKTLVMVVEHIEGDDPYSFSINVGNKYGVGNAETNTGLIVTLATLDRSYYILTGEGLEGDLPDAICKRVENRVMVPFLKEGDWNNAIACTVDTLSMILQSPDGQEFVSENEQVRSEEDDDMSFFELLIAVPITLAIVLFFVWLMIKLTLMVPNIIYLLIHDREEVQMTRHDKKIRFLLALRDSVWCTGNDYYYLKNKKKVFFFYSSSNGGGGYSGGGSGHSHSSSSGGGSSHGSSGGGSFGGGGAGGRF